MQKNKGGRKDNQRQLLEYAKQKHNTLSLGVYQKNNRAVALYLREGFLILSEEIDKSTGETEYTMIWKKIAAVRKWL